MELLSTSVLLLLVLDPVGNIPVFLGVLERVPEERRLKIVARELLIALVVLVSFLFLGRYLLLVLQISQASLGVAGGIILFLIALRMVFPVSRGTFQEVPQAEPFIVPLAIPLIAGPAAMALLMLLMGREPSKWYVWLFSLLIAWAVSSSILLLAGPMARLLHARALIAIERLTGLILTAVAVEMFINGLTEAYRKIAWGA